MTARGPTARVLAYLHLERQAEQAEGQSPPEFVDQLDAAWQLLSPDEVAWLRNRAPEPGNAFEAAARGRKVLKLLQFVPVGASAAENKICAEWLAGFSPPERGLFAKMAKCNAPSEETWRQLVEAVRARRTVDEVMEEVDPFARGSES